LTYIGGATSGYEEGERSKLYKSNIIEDPNRMLGARFVMYYNATGNSVSGNSGTEYMTMEHRKD
jgi:hypothetical protein